MKEDYATNSHFLTYTFLFKRLGEWKFLILRSTNRTFRQNHLSNAAKPFWNFKLIHTNSSTFLHFRRELDEDYDWNVCQRKLKHGSFYLAGVDDSPPRVLLLLYFSRQDNPAINAFSSRDPFNSKTNSWHFRNGSVSVRIQKVVACITGWRFFLYNFGNQAFQFAVIRPGAKQRLSNSFCGWPRRAVKAAFVVQVPTQERWAGPEHAQHHSLFCYPMTPRYKNRMSYPWYFSRGSKISRRGVELAQVRMRTILKLCVREGKSGGSCCLDRRNIRGQVPLNIFICWYALWTIAQPRSKSVDIL